MKTIEPKKQVWSCGGGTQSCAIAVLIIQGKLPKPDISVIADTGYETRTTWEYMEAYLAPGLAKVGIELVKVSASEWAYNGKSTFSLKNSQLILPCFTSENGIGKLSAFCSRWWKQDVVTRWLSKTQNLTRSKVVKWIGFSRDEQRRIISMQQGEEFKKGLIRFPILEQGLTRRDCIKLVEDFGWPTPPRSACWMCPNHGDHEWRLIKTQRPDEFQKAVELEREIHKVDPDAWLHRSCVPLDEVDFSQPEDLFSRACDSGMCFV